MLIVVVILSIVFEIVCVCYVYKIVLLLVFNENLDL